MRKQATLSVGGGLIDWYKQRKEEKLNRLASACDKAVANTNTSMSVEDLRSFVDIRLQFIAALARYRDKLGKVMRMEQGMTTTYVPSERCGSVLCPYVLLCFLYNSRGDYQDDFDYIRKQAFYVRLDHHNDANYSIVQDQLNKCDGRDMSGVLNMLDTANYIYKLFIESIQKVCKEASILKWVQEKTKSNPLLDPEFDIWIGNVKPQTHVVTTPVERDLTGYKLIIHENKQNIVHRNVSFMISKSRNVTNISSVPTPLKTYLIGSKTPNGFYVVADAQAGQTRYFKFILQDVKNWTIIETKARVYTSPDESAYLGDLIVNLQSAVFGGKNGDRVKYKDRQYKVRYGQRGGAFILVGKGEHQKKIYIRNKH